MMKYNCEQFEHLYTAVSRYSNDAKIKIGFATGTILGYRWRLFQVDEDEVDGYSAWLGIADKTSNGSIWPAFYNGIEIDDWYKDHYLEDSVNHTKFFEWLRKVNKYDLYNAALDLQYDVTDQKTSLSASDTILEIWNEYWDRHG